MILLTPTRLTAEGAFSYWIDAPEMKVTAPDDATAALILTELGVENPMPLIAHAQTWGTIEILSRSEKDDRGTIGAAK
jgi:hypothetical protein